MFKSKPKIKDLHTQTPEEKMYLLKLTAQQMLGAKWMYYRKIKQGDQGLKLLKQSSLMEQMKATRSALRFTTKNTRKLYRSAYTECIKDIKKCTGLKEVFPELAETGEGEDLPSLTNEYDAIIIGWCPLKFLLPAQKIRAKGSATQRHSEGLVAKLYFKVSAYYAADENWDRQKLTFYLRKIRHNSSYQDVVTQLEPLKNDLEKFVTAYELFKFGKASLSKDVSQDIDAFDDAMSVESTGSQIRTLYWYNFIYQAIEHFIFRYYLILLTSTASIKAIQYITEIFKPALQKAVENRVVFMGSFETDRTKTSFRKPFKAHIEERKKEPVKKNIKTKRGLFECYRYNLQMLDQTNIRIDLHLKPAIDSEFGMFVNQYILGIDRPNLVIDEKYLSDGEVESGFEIEEPEISHIETRKHIFLQLITSMINGSFFKNQAKYIVLERYKTRVKSDIEIEKKRIADIKKASEKKIREVQRKLSKYRRLKQEETVKNLEKDIEKFKFNIEGKIKSIREGSKEEIDKLKKSLNSTFQEIAKEKEIGHGIAADLVVKLIEELDDKNKFLGSLPDFIAKTIQLKYNKELEPLYSNLFNIFELSTREKIMLIQSLEKSGGENSVKLSLSDSDQNSYKNSIQELKIRINKKIPGLFNFKIQFFTNMIKIEDLFELSIDNKSLHNLLCLKISSPAGKSISVKSEDLKAMVELNKFINPTPQNNVSQEGMEKDKNYERRINSSKLENLLRNIEN